MSWPDLCISIHALREEGDEDCKPTWTTLENFYPRPPRGGRRQTSANKLSSTKFLSTPSARRATHQSAPTGIPDSISIHALREEGDQAAHSSTLSIFGFLSTPSARRATCSLRPRGILTIDFYPRPPRGGRLYTSRATRTVARISIHALREEGDEASCPLRHR